MGRCECTCVHAQTHIYDLLWIGALSLDTTRFGVGMAMVYAASRQFEDPIPERSLGAKHYAQG